MFYNEKKGLWQDYIRVDGKRKRISAKKKADLNRKRDEYRTTQEHGELFSTVADAWEKKHSETIEPTTAAAYTAHVNRAKQFFEGEYVNDITPAEVQAFIDELASMGYARDTVHRARTVLNKIFNYAITMPGSMLRINPVTAVQTPRGLSHTRREPPTEEQLIKVNPSTEMGLFACFLLYTGLRRGELLALQWNDISFENRTITINKVIQFSGNVGTVKDMTKTAAGMRVVPLLDELHDILLPIREKRGYIFGGEQPLTAGQINRKWVEWCKEVGLAEKKEYSHTAANKHTYTQTKWKPLVTPHQFRHQYATMLFEAGVDDLDTKTTMGHSSIVVTRDIYQHIQERDKESQVAQKMNDFIKQQKSKKQ